jgi:phenylacetate-CoA ligase
MSTLYTRCASGLLFPLHERLKGHHSLALRRELEASQWRSPERIAAAREQRLRAFLCHIAEHVPWYQRLFREHGIDPASIDSNALSRLPTLGKDELRKHAGDFKTRLPTTLQAFNTGGSSGQPLQFFLGERVSHDVAAKWRATRWWNVDIGDRELVLWGSPIELKAQDRVRRWRDALLRTRLFPAFDLGERGIRAFIETFREFRPTMLFGYPSAFERIARYAVQQGIDLHSADLRVCFVTAERLYDEQRSAIAKAFGVPVANGYGSRDAGFIAHECPAGGMHISAEHLLIETLRPDGSRTAPGDAGEVTVTHLHTRDFPFLRYRTGDCAVLSERHCACGRGLPLLERIDGRTTDFVYALDGTAMHGLALIYVLREIPGVEQFRLIQHRIDDLEVLLVVANWNEEKSARIVTGLKRRLGEGVQVRLNFCDHIPTEQNGKYRYVISKVTPP